MKIITHMNRFAICLINYLSIITLTFNLVAMSEDSLDLTKDRIILNNIEIFNKLKSPERATLTLFYEQIFIKKKLNITCPLPSMSNKFWFILYELLRNTPDTQEFEIIKVKLGLADSKIIFTINDDKKIETEWKQKDYCSYGTFS